MSAGGAVGLRRGRARADQVAEERAAGLRLGGAADADEPAAALDVGLERGLLRGVELVAGVAEEDDGPVLAEVDQREVGRILALSTLKSLIGAERLDRADAGVDRGVGRAVEDERP